MSLLLGFDLLGIDMITQSQYPFPQKMKTLEYRFNIEEQKDNINLCVGLKVGSVLRAYHRKNITDNPRAIVIKYFDMIIGFVKQNSVLEDIFHKERLNSSAKFTWYVTKINKYNPTLPMIEIGCKINKPDLFYPTQPQETDEPF